MGANAQKTTSSPPLTIQPPNLTPELDSFQLQAKSHHPSQQFMRIVANARRARTQRVLPAPCYRPSPAVIRIAPFVPNEITSLGKVLTEGVYRAKILTFLSFQDLNAVKGVNKRLRGVVTRDMLQKDNNWQNTLCLLAPYIERYKILRQSSMESEYEHSEDLDRTSGYFDLDESSLMESKVKLDKVVTAVSFHVKYFQGVMPIVAVLLQCFNQTTSYWLLKYLLFRCSYIQTDMAVYQAFLRQLEEEFKAEMPELYTHLEELEFELNYFVMKWIMGLFSEDLPKHLLLSFWDCLCQTDLYMLLCLILTIFRHFESKLLESDADGINELLKWELKSRLENVPDLVVLSKRRYIKGRLQTNKVS